MWPLRLGIQTCSFEIEDLSEENAVKQHGAEAGTGFQAAACIQQAVKAGATCLGRSRGHDMLLGWALSCAQDVRDWWTHQMQDSDPLTVTYSAAICGSSQQCEMLCSLAAAQTSLKVPHLVERLAAHQED